MVPWDHRGGCLDRSRSNHGRPGEQETPPGTGRIGNLRREAETEIGAPDRHHNEQ
jgi:hypothetical protein